MHVASHLRAPSQRHRRPGARREPIRVRTGRRRTTSPRGHRATHPSHSNRPRVHECAKTSRAQPRTCAKHWPPFKRPISRIRSG